MSTSISLVLFSFSARIVCRFGASIAFLLLAVDAQELRRRCVMRTLIPAMGMMAVCGLAHAEVIHWSQLIAPQAEQPEIRGSGATMIDLSGLTSNDFQGDPDNHILSIHLGAGSTITSIAWNVNLTTVGVSWADEATITFNGIQSINPGAGDAFTVTSQNYAGSTASGLVVDASGILQIELHEIGFDDNPDEPDAIYEDGSYIQLITFVPSPGSLSAFGLAGLVGARRRRRLS
jgi:hypothetical protein